MTDSELVQVSSWIPKDMIPEYNRLVAELSEGTTQADEDGDDHWSERELAWIRDATQVSFKRAALMLTELSKTPNEEVRFSELAKRCGLSESDLKGLFNGFGKGVKGWFGEASAPPWGISYEFLPAGSKHQTENTYWVDDVTAKRWTKVTQ